MKKALLLYILILFTLFAKRSSPVRFYSALLLITMLKLPIIRSNSSLWLMILAWLWFGIGGTVFFYYLLPWALWEWKTYSPIESDLKKRDVLFPGWYECVKIIQERVPLGAELVFLSNVEEERYTYLNYLLNYEIYPLRHLHKLDYRLGIRPRFVVIYLGSPSGLRFEHYRKLYESPRVVLLEKQR